MKHLTLPAHLTVPVVALGLLAACSSDPTPPADRATTTTTYTSSPVAPYMSLLALSTEEQLRVTLEAERLIASCLKEQGFDYDERYIPDDVPLDGSVDPVEWASEYGYGVSTLTSEPSSEPVALRSPAEEAAYEEALYGTSSATDEEGDVHYDWESQGCLGSAYHEATAGMDEVLRDERFSAFFDAYETITAQVSTSDEAAALADEWSGCMADAGHPDLQTPLDARQSAERALADARDEHTAPAALSSALATLRAEETALAVVDLGCQAETDYAARYDQLLWAAQATLLDDFAGQLDDLAAATGS